MKISTTSNLPWQLQHPHSHSLLQQFSAATPDQALDTTIPIDIETNYEKFQELESLTNSFNLC